MHAGVRSQSMRQPVQGAYSSRPTHVVSLATPQPGKAASSTQKQENTDSDFFNLTAEDESQIDPILVMRNLSNTQLCSNTTSIIQIQESSEPRGSFKQSF